MRKKHYTSDSGGIDFTAIMDIAFVVMILFFGATFFLVEAGKEDPVPEQAVEYVPEFPPIWVEIDATGLVTIDGRPRERAAIYDIIATQLASRPGAEINIDVHEDADTEVLALVLEITRALDVESVNVNTGSES